MTQVLDTTQSDYWEQRYNQGLTGWNLKTHHPLLPKLFAKIRQLAANDTNGSVLVPGAGHAHCAAFWANAGYATTAADFAPSAIQLARNAYGHLPLLTIIETDIIANPLGKERFDIIFDRAMLCALSPEIRSKYVEAAYHMLKPGGIFALITFSHCTNEVGPPWPVPVLALHDLLKNSFNLLFAEDHKHQKISADQVIQGESLSLWLKK